MTLFLSFTGYLLPWDQLAFWAITVGTAIAGYAPVVGQQVRFLLLGDATVGQEALLRFYVLHVAVLPLVMTLLIVIHFWRIRKDGGLSRNNCRRRPMKRSPPSRRLRWPWPRPATRPTGCRASCAGPFSKVGNVPEKTVFAWPNLVIAELFVFVLTLAILLVVALAFDAPLEEPVSILHPPNPAKAPWYFLGLQEMVSYSAFWGGVGIPTIFVILLLLTPYIDRGKEGVGKWFARERLLSQHGLPDVCRHQHHLRDHRHVLPGRQLGVCLPVEVRF